MAQATVTNITDRRAYESKLATAFSSLESDIFDLECMAQLTASYVEDFLKECSRPNGYTDEMQVVMFAVHETLNKAGRVKRMWQERHAAAR
jgi:hypothetical protein